ncbi:MAG: ARMT1-like domain-containing protein [Candidatus Marinimicrobia bacterium]|nr:ARMT1-like domain-containing protein [Candidatus Neomarinimicrobiota bacterium]MCF7827561.1 ARMT1-like domain-containing protein [Candidatus Neomarinimicrobiota bacterium]MCF7881577.1 ARMT1-like domain-containing protein [Candidatus Neomarinimicrobiota bacterium]
MNIQPECYPCALSQVLEAARRVNLDTDIQYDLLRKTMEHMLKVSSQTTMPEVGQFIHRMVRDYSDAHDPYHREKTEFNTRLLDLLPSIRRKVQDSNAPLRTAIRYAIAGNVIDFAKADAFIDLDGELERACSNTFAIEDFDHFRERLNSSESLVYLGDNAGEIVMDRLLIETIQSIYDIEITYVVRGAPVLNDATVEDSEQVDMSRIVNVISNGTDAPGTLYNQVSAQVRQLLDSADMIVAKGQGNFESLSETPLDIFFLFKIKCGAIADRIGAPVQQYILANSESVQNRRRSHEHIPC